jgi:hypothetical protein
MAFELGFSSPSLGRLVIFPYKFSGKRQATLPVWPPGIESAPAARRATGADQDRAAESAFRLTRAFLVIKTGAPLRFGEHTPEIAARLERRSH